MQMTEICAVRGDRLKIFNHISSGKPPPNDAMCPPSDTSSATVSMRNEQAMRSAGIAVGKERKRPKPSVQRTFNLALFHFSDVESSASTVQRRGMLALLQWMRCSYVVRRRRELQN